MLGFGGGSLMLFEVLSELSGVVVDVVEVFFVSDDKFIVGV